MTRTWPPHHTFTNASSSKKILKAPLSPNVVYTFVCMLPEPSKEITGVMREQMSISAPLAFERHGLAGEGQEAATQVEKNLCVQAR